MIYYANMAALIDLWFPTWILGQVYICMRMEAPHDLHSMCMDARKCDKVRTEIRESSMAYVAAVVKS